MTGYRWLLMDADNTLFDFTSAESYSIQCTLTHFGVPFTPQLQESYRAINAALWRSFDRGEITQGTLATERFERFFDAQGMDGDAEEWNRVYRDFLSRCHTLMPGAEPICRKLANFYILALCTNGIPQVQRRRLADSPLARYFGERVFISEELGVRKPDRRFFEAVLDALGARRQRGRCLVVGDSLSSDIRGAFNARLDSVWVRPPGAKPGAMRPTYEIDSLSQLPALLGVDRLVPLALGEGTGPRK